MDPIASVIDGNMCTGCGLCAEAEGMKMNPEGFLRPVRWVTDRRIQACCPGLQVDHGNREADYDPAWGPILSCETAFSTDPAIRQAGSSGGVITALATHLLRTGQVDEVIQIGASPTEPLRNRTFRHDDPGQALRHAGSRYAPSAPLEHIRSLLGNGRKYLFIGKPCDTAALRALMNSDPAARKQFPVLLSFMCAGVPSEQATHDILARFDVQPGEVSEFRYRGNGWPGLTRITTDSGQEHTLTYNESWGTILNKKLQPRCKVCADGIGEAADIVCADAWHASDKGYPSFEEQDGRSLMLVRTAAGRQLVQTALQAGAIASQPYPVDEIATIQPYQLNRKRTSLARSAAVRLTGGHVPRFKGYQLLGNAAGAGLRNNLKTFLGTVKRRMSGRL